MFGGMANVCTLRIGMLLTASSDTPIIQMTTAGSDVHQPSPNCILAASGPIAPMAPRRRGHADEEFLRVAGLVLASSIALNRASRSTMQTAYSSTTIQPIRECDSSVP